MELRVKRVYDAPTDDDGLRVLVDRLWPRGVTKERAAVDVWAKDVAPTSELRRAFHHDGLEWAAFAAAYRVELAENPAVVQLRETLAGHPVVTLLYGAHDAEHNHAQLVRLALLAGVPLDDVAVPPKVADLARGAALVPVWRNEIGGITFRTDDGRYVKWGPRNAESTMADEAERMRWAARFTRVPAVLEVGADATHEWLVTVAIPGESAVAPRWIAEPARAVAAVGRGLRALHDALPVADCPFSWQVADRIANAQARGIRVPQRLYDHPAVDLLVVSHGDACCPNTVLDDRGAPVGHVDLAALGVADRWADIAVASMSTEWNYGAGWDDALIAAYGVEPDRERLAYYRELWNAT